MYQSCTTEGCQKKVLDLGNGLYRCEKCNRETSTYKWRLMLSVSIFVAKSDSSLSYDTSNGRLSVFVGCLNQNWGIGYGLAAKCANSGHRIYFVTHFPQLYGAFFL